MRSPEQMQAALVLVLIAAVGFAKTQSIPTQLSFKLDQGIVIVEGAIVVGVIVEGAIVVGAIVEGAIVEGGMEMDVQV
jgi:hypothetical protein